MVVAAPNALICLDADIQGDVTIGARTIVHPKARIIAQDGPIVIGENNLIEEQTLIINSKQPGGTDGATLTIGDNNTFEVGSVCQAKSMGDNNVLETKAKVGPRTKLTNGCVIGALCETNLEETLEENTIICGDNNLRRKMAEPPASQSQQVDFLRKLLPNYHFLLKKE